MEVSTELFGVVTKSNVKVATDFATSTQSRASRNRRQTYNYSLDLLFKALALLA